MIVTIDGPAGAGKSTAARKLANKLGFIHLNSGALFRAVAYKVKKQALCLSNDEEIAALAASTNFEFRLSDSEAGHLASAPASSNKQLSDSNSSKPKENYCERITYLLVDGCDISDCLRSDEIGQIASRIAVLPLLRDVLLQVQRKVAQGQSVVLEGRDSGTVVFPQAEVKFYLDAAPEERAQRRFQELLSTGKAQGLTLTRVAEEMQQRDKREMSREVAPLRPAEDALLLDSTGLSQEEVVQKMIDVVEQAGLKKTA